MKPVIKKWFTDAGFTVRMYEVHCKNADKDKEFQKFKEDTEDGIIKLCLSVNMVSEGIHGDIDGVIMLRNTISPNLYFQMIGRAFACGKKTIPLIFDLVANSHFITDTNISFPNELRGEIEKRKKECEKESKDYEVGFDVDEFIVMDEFMDVVSGFKAIEERLQGSWENGLKHFDKYVREHNGDVLVPFGYKDEDGFLLGNWVNNERMRLRNNLLDQNKVNELNKRKFVWNIPKYNFEKKVRLVAEYYKENGEYPSTSDERIKVKKLGNFVINERIKAKNASYPQWKMKIINKYLSQFFYKSRSDLFFDTFVEHLKLYKEKYGHLNIHTKDVIYGYNIGSNFSDIKKYYRNNKLSTDRIIKLKMLGLSLDYASENNFCSKINLVKEAVKNGVVISRKNQIYKQVNLYIWIKSTIKKKYKNNQLKSEEKIAIENILGKTLEEFFTNKIRDKAKGTKIIDIVENKEIAICESACQAAKIIHNKFSIKINCTSILERLNGKVTTPYKGRFMFYYATDEEIKKYFEDGKVS